MVRRTKQMQPSSFGHVSEVLLGRAVSCAEFMDGAKVVVVPGFVNVPSLGDAFNLMFAAAGEVSGHVADVEILRRRRGRHVHQPTAGAGARDCLRALHGGWLGG